MMLVVIAVLVWAVGFVIFLNSERGKHVDPLDALILSSLWPVLLPLSALFWVVEKAWGAYVKWLRKEEPTK